MSRIRSRDTKPELAVRSALHRAGFRFRLHARDLPGRPDIVFRPLRTVIQVRGCFWHGHDCAEGRPPKSNVQFWTSKIESNVARDIRTDGALRDLGYTVLIVWECDLASPGRIQDAVDGLVDHLSRARNERRVRRPQTKRRIRDTDPKSSERCG
jgi:DNA mismatch endonuclease (patch repair protein)